MGYQHDNNTRQVQKLGPCCLLPINPVRKSLFASFFAHGVTLLILFQMPQIPFLRQVIDRIQAPSLARKQIFYVIPVSQKSALFARITPPGPGGQPGRGELEQKNPPLGSTAFHGELEAVSNPPNPDNARQTIIQPDSSPDLRIKEEIRVPNVALGNPLLAQQHIDLTSRAPGAAPRSGERRDLSAPKLTRAVLRLTPPVFAASVTQPVLQEQIDLSAHAPKRKASNDRSTIAPKISVPPTILSRALTPSTVEPRLPIPPPEPIDLTSRVRTRTAHTREHNNDVVAPEIFNGASGLNMSRFASSIAQPGLPIPSAPNAIPSTATGGNTTAERGGRDTAADRQGKSQSGTIGGGADLGGASAEGKNLLAISTNPGPETSIVTLPPGQKFGAFSLSPGGKGRGSPGGTGNTAGAGQGGGHMGGDPSVGVGPGKSGGGGGDSSGSSVISVTGPLTASISAPKAYVNMIFPVLGSPHVRKNEMIISAGSVGGGGLAVYRALQCGRVYTVFLPMPKGNWTLQYCVAGSVPSRPVRSRGSTVVHLEAPLVPPDAVQKFDFHRLPVPKEKFRKNIVLKGMIRENGSVDNLHIYQGVLPEMDEAALLAFTSWHFAPAKRAGKPIAVEILVGIPVSASAN